MKKARKGFTLVELLIVMAIVAALAATMSVSMKSGVAKAKAAAIMANFDTARTAAAEYYSLHINDAQATLAAIKLQDALKDSLAGWTDSGMTKGNTVYTADGNLTDGTGTITATFATDPSVAEIATALQAISDARGTIAAASDGYITVTATTGPVTMVIKPE